jgi:RNase P subunit RPR2
LFKTQDKEVRFNYNSFNISIILWENVVVSSDYLLYLNQVWKKLIFFFNLFLYIFILASNSIDIKARQRIEELYELTDEIINAYNEINEKYVNQIYRKYKQLQEINKNLKEKLNHHHCTGCKCTIQSDNEEEEEEDEADDEEIKNSTLPSSTTSSVVTRSKKKNRSFI